MENKTNSDNETKELLHLKRKELIDKLVLELSKEDDQFYYYPTVEVAALIIEMRDKGKLPVKDREIIEGLDLQDIQVLLSHKN